MTVLSLLEEGGNEFLMPWYLQYKQYMVICHGPEFDWGSVLHCNQYQEYPLAVNWKVLTWEISTENQINLL
jgi:hypothetical protein